VTRYDALLVVSFGGPEGPSDVLPFLRNVTRGKGIPAHRLTEVAEHYLRFGGGSPINAQNRTLVAAVATELARRGLPLPVYWGNRNWAPLLPDTLRQMAADGVRRALVLLTSAYASYSGCRQYREDLAAARAEVGPTAPELDRVRQYYNHPGFLGPQVAATLAALQRLPPDRRGDAELVFVTHSLPLSLADSSGPAGGAYVAQHREVCRLVAAGVAERDGRTRRFDLVYCSRSGPPAQAWLEPDVNDHLAARAAEGARAVVLVPIGFLSDHMEVRFDLDVAAAGTARELGLAAARAATVGADPVFVAGVADLVQERWAEVAPAERAAVGVLGPAPDHCPPGCCPNPRGARPTVGEADRPPSPTVVAAP